MPARRWKMLDNTLYKLKNNKELTIGFFGGSITEGAGASDASRTSWRGSDTGGYRRDRKLARDIPL